MLIPKCKFHILLATILHVASFSVFAAAPIQATYYASPNGSGKLGTIGAPSSLTGVRDLVRTVNRNMTGDIIINLRGGTYALAEPFQLIESADIHDSGTNGFNIIYRAYPGETPILSGGLPLSGWTLHDRAKNIFKAQVPVGTRSRQFYINDYRATRARSGRLPDGWKKTAAGWTISDPSMQGWGNPTDIEIVSRSEWKHLRCDIASISGNAVTMKMPGWANCSKSPRPGNPWNGEGSQAMNKVEWIENAYELLREPGQWYLDSKAGYVYYIPLPDEDINKLPAVLPILETLLDVHGTSYEQRIHNLRFVGLTFKYATWMQPSGDQGYADNQAGVVWVNIPPVSAKTPGNLSFQYAINIRFENNVVAHMGGAGIDFGHGPQNNAIVGNCLYDISGNGIFLGEVDDFNVTDPAAWCDGNIIQNNYITKTGAEFEDQVGICTGYTRHLLLDHNEIYDVPYSGISVGWGWSTMGYSHQNSITNNHVHHFMRILSDGGGIYTLGNQGTNEERTIWSGNYLHRSGHAQGLYADEGSGFMEIKNNVVTDIQANWLNLWTKSIHDIVAHDNFSDRSSVKNAGTNCLASNNVMDVKPENIPQAAQDIIKNAGLEPSYALIKDNVPPPPEVVVNDQEQTITYVGSWSRSVGRKYGDVDNDVHVTTENGTSASLAFYGLGIDYVTECNADEGEVNVYIDGVLAKTVDCNSPERVAQKAVFHQVWDQAGKHEIKIEKKSGRFMILDAFRIYHRIPRTTASRTP